VTGHFRHQFGRPWVKIDDYVTESSAKIVGAHQDEVAIMNSLTANLHFMMVPFYRPTPTKYKILMEGKAFPSDYFAFESQVQFHGYDPKDAIVQVQPREGSLTLETSDIIKVIEEEGDQVALVLFSGVQYYTGQLFDIKAITEAAQKKVAI
jgi:kynureninase